MMMDDDDDDDDHLKYATTTHDSFKRLYKKEYFYAPT